MLGWPLAFSDKLGQRLDSSFYPLLQAVRAFVPSALVGGASWAAACDLAHWLPAGSGDHEFGFECPLSDPVPAADFGIGLAPGYRASECFRVLARERFPPLRELLDSNLGVGVGPRDELSEVRRLLVEFDVRRGVETPAVFVVPRARFWRSIPPRVLASVARTVPFVSRADLHAALESVFSAGAEIGSLGVFPGRSPRSVRVDAVVSTAAAGAALMRQLQWAGDESRLAGLLEQFSDAPGLWLCFDLAGGRVPAPRLGMEVHGSSLGWADPSLPFWRGFFSELVSGGLCVPEKARSALACHGTAWARVFGTAVPVTRGINHVKFVLDGERVSAKVYLGFGFGDPLSAR